MEKKPETTNLSPVQKLSDTVKLAIAKVDEYVNNGSLVLPPNYAVGNSLRNAQLTIQDNENIMNCTQASIYKSLIAMAICGLNPSVEKAQCYFIAYGRICSMQPSYYGYKLIAQRIDKNIKDIVASVVHEDEIFEFDTRLDGYFDIIKHKKSLKSMNSKNVLGAYATIYYRDDTPTKSLIMTFDRILESWKMSPARPFDNDGKLKQSSTHYRFMDDMCIRTVMNKITAPIRRSSDDSSLFMQTLKELEIEAESSRSDSVVEATQSDDSSVIDIPYEQFDPEEPSTTEGNQTST